MPKRKFSGTGKENPDQSTPDGVPPYDLFNTIVNKPEVNYVGDHDLNLKQTSGPYSDNYDITTRNISSLTRTRPRTHTRTRTRAKEPEPQATPTNEVVAIWSELATQTRGFRATIDGKTRRAAKMLGGLFIADEIREMIWRALGDPWFHANGSLMTIASNPDRYRRKLSSNPTVGPPGPQSSAPAAPYHQTYVAPDWGDDDASADCGQDHAPKSDDDVDT